MHECWKVQNDVMSSAPSLNLSAQLPHVLKANCANVYFFTGYSVVDSLSIQKANGRGLWVGCGGDCDGLR